MRRPSDCQIVRITAGPRARSTLLWAAAVIALLQCEAVPAGGVYKCVGADGTPSYSDSSCDSKAEHPRRRRLRIRPEHLEPPGACPSLPRALLPPSAVLTASPPISAADTVIHAGVPGLAGGRPVPGATRRPEAGLDARGPALGAADQYDRGGYPHRRSRARPFLRGDADQSLVRTLASRLQEADVDTPSSFFRSPRGSVTSSFRAR